jgi:CDP-glycerol glycerophosphotransferase (TagB/SpsB family)
MHNSYSIKKSSIYLVGSARNDTLENINSNKEVILVAPTWRIWLKDLESLQNTDFFQSYVSVLTNENLCNYLEENNIYIHFYLHHMFHRFIDDFLSLENKVIKILPVNANISLEIKSSQMLITDYSSIGSDFYYLKKPVLFYQFDRGEYIQKIGSEIDLTLDEFGNVYCDKKELLEGILHTLKEQYKLSKKQLAGESFFVNFQDQKNCKRIYGIIESILKSKVESHMDIKFNH